MKLTNPFKLIITIFITELAGGIGSLFTFSIPTWYATLAKPALNPPNWVFAPVWTTLFLLMGLAAFLIWKEGLDKKEVKIALAVFLGQLILNSLWSFIFFGWHNPGAAFLELIILWLAILATILTFYKVSRPAAYLLIPYIFWVTFAGYLNFSIWRLAVADVTPTPNIACTMKAKICPDGSAVGRGGLNCEFAPCPANPSPADNYLWKTITDQGSGQSYQYPETLLTKYLHPLTWPPQIQVIADKPFTCLETGSEIMAGGKTAKRLVDNRTYCVTSAAEGAAGSTYTDYAYAFPKKGMTMIFTFTIQTVQCANYDEPQKTACENERQSFDLDSVIDRMANTIE